MKDGAQGERMARRMIRIRVIEIQEVTYEDDENEREYGEQRKGGEADSREGELVSESCELL